MLGTSFSAQAAEDDNYLQKLLFYYKQVTESVEHSAGISDPLKISILSGIALVDELYKEKQRYAALSDSAPVKDADKVQEIAQSLVKRIDEALG